ncbi:MAG: hypothetical protein HKN19_15575 [Halioglobus sp.]|nr:hypothetical protein [Halioglobus sp.]
MRTLFLHIGFPKTGSSALQSWLSLNAVALVQQGIGYADLAPRAKHGEPTSGNGFVLFNALREQDTSRVEKLVADTYFTGTANRTAVVSSEFLPALSKQKLLQLRELCADHNIEVRIIAYVRSPYERAYSAYVQDLKTKGRADPFGFADIAENLERTRSYLLKYLRVFRGCVTVLNYDDRQRTIFEAFAQATGMDLEKLELLDKRVNRSLTNAEVSIMRRLNALHDGRFARPLSKHLLRSAPGRPTPFPYDEQLLRRVRAESLEGLEWINTTFGVTPPVGPDLLGHDKPPALLQNDPREIYDLVASWLLAFTPEPDDAVEFTAFIGAVMAVLENTATDKELLRECNARAQQLIRTAGNSE